MTEPVTDAVSISIGFGVITCPCPAIITVAPALEAVYVNVPCLPNLAPAEGEVILTLSGATIVTVKEFEESLNRLFSTPLAVIVCSPILVIVSVVSNLPVFGSGAALPAGAPSTRNSIEVVKAVPLIVTNLFSLTVAFESIGAGIVLMIGKDAVAGLPCFFPSLGIIVTV